MKNVFIILIVIISFSCLYDDKSFIDSKNTINEKEIVCPEWTVGHWENRSGFNIWISSDKIIYTFSRRYRKKTINEMMSLIQEKNVFYVNNIIEQYNADNDYLKFKYFEAKVGCEVLISISVQPCLYSYHYLIDKHVNELALHISSMETLFQNFGLMPFVLLRVSD